MATGSRSGHRPRLGEQRRADLAGYNVYRSASATGTFSKVNAACHDVGLQRRRRRRPASTSFYRVTAVDSSANESPVSDTASATRTAAGLRINTGGPAQTVGGVTWSACTSLTACNGYVTGGFPFAQSPVPTITGIVTPANQAIYQTEWTGGQTNGVPAGGVAFTFGVPVTNGTYQVRLHFAELNKNGAGLRVFDVNIEGGANELTGFDICSQAAGINKAIVREFTTTVTDGTSRSSSSARSRTPRSRASRSCRSPPTHAARRADHHRAGRRQLRHRRHGHPRPARPRPAAPSTLFEGTTSRGTATATAGGAGASTLTGVADGVHAYTATATDAAPNTSPASAARTITVDTSARPSPRPCPPPTPPASRSAPTSARRSPSRWPRPA